MDSINGLEIHSTDEVLSILAMYLRTASEAHDYDPHSAARDLYDELCGKKLIRTFEEQVKYAFSKGRNDG